MASRCLSWASVTSLCLPLVAVAHVATPRVYSIGTSLRYGVIPRVLSKPVHGLARTGSKSILKLSAMHEGDTRGAAEEMSHGANIALNMTFRRRVVEGQRPLSDYVRLPAEKYSLLDSSQITRLGDSSFQMDMGKIGFLGIVRLRPTIVVDVDTKPSGALQTIRSISFQGRPKRMINLMNAIFGDISWGNLISSEKASDTESDIVFSLTMDWGLPHLSGMSGSSPKALEFLFSRALQIAVPWFMTQLEKDYVRWASGDNSREALSKGELIKMASEMALKAARGGEFDEEEFNKTRVEVTSPQHRL